MPHYCDCFAKHFKGHLEIHSEASIGVLKKMLLEFWSIHPLAFQKNSFHENFGKLPIKTSILESFIQVHL